MSTEPLLLECLRILGARGWVQVPTERGPSRFVHGEHLLDRIQVFGGRWSHHRFDGTSWQTHAEARGDDEGSLAAYLTKHFRSGGR
jgi:hypothetical protein